MEDGDALGNTFGEVIGDERSLCAMSRGDSVMHDGCSRIDKNWSDHSPIQEDKKFNRSKEATRKREEGIDEPERPRRGKASKKKKR